MFYVMKLDWTSTNTNLTSSDRPLLMAIDRHINSIRTRDGRPSGGKENIFTGSLLLFIINNYCRTHRVPTYPWLFLLLLLLLLLLGPVSDFDSQSLIYHIQASGSPQPIHFLKAHDVSYPNTNTKTKTVTKTMTKTKTPRE